MVKDVLNEHEKHEAAEFLEVKPALEDHEKDQAANILLLGQLQSGLQGTKEDYLVKLSRGAEDGGMFVLAKDTESHELLGLAALKGRVETPDGLMAQELGLLAVDTDKPKDKIGGVGIKIWNRAMAAAKGYGLGAIYTETVLSNYASLRLQYQVQKEHEVLGFFNEDWTGSDERDERNFITLAVNLFPLNVESPEDLEALKDAIRTMYRDEMDVELSEDLPGLLMQKKSSLEHSNGDRTITTLGDLLNSYFNLDPTFFKPKLDSALEFVRSSFMGDVDLADAV